MQLSLYHQLAWGQMDAALQTVELCILKCPDDIWRKKVGNLEFNQVAMHTLIFADLYLSRSEDQEAFKAQPFCIANAKAFADYEEFSDRKQVNIYEKPFILEYATHCRTKAREVIFGETEASLAGPSGFSWQKRSRAEIHVYNTRHVQHHAAQLSLRLRVDAGIDVPWVGSGKVLV